MRKTLRAAWAIGTAAAAVLGVSLLVAHAQSPVSSTWAVLRAPTASAQCPATAPTVAAQAGLTTMALCYDFTQAIPNTAGTGLPSNTSGNCYGGSGCWIGCPDVPGDSDAPGHVWWSFSTCNESGSGVTQRVDSGGGGNLALNYEYTLADGNSFTIRELATIVNPCCRTTDPRDPANAGYFTDYPMGKYVQITYRDNIPSAIPCPAGNPNSGCQPNIDFWDWTAAHLGNITYLGDNNYAAPILETDHIEIWGQGLCSNNVSFG
jgi:hypothetical protein